MANKSTSRIKLIQPHVAGDTKTACVNQRAWVSTHMCKDARAPAETKYMTKCLLANWKPGPPDAPDSHRGPRTKITKKGCYEWCYDGTQILDISLCYMFILVPGSSRAGLDRHSVSNFARLAMACARLLVGVGALGHSSCASDNQKTLR